MLNRRRKRVNDDSYESHVRLWRMQGNAEAHAAWARLESMPSDRMTRLLEAGVFDPVSNIVRGQ